MNYSFAVIFIYWSAETEKYSALDYEKAVYVLILKVKKIKTEVNDKNKNTIKIFFSKICFFND